MIGKILVESPEIAVVIPTYNEEKLVMATLENLHIQTATKRGEVEIIIADFDPENNNRTKAAVTGFPNVKYVSVYGKGISHARRIGIKNTNAKYIINFDADAVFDSNEAIDKMITPLKRDPSLAYTFVDNVPTTEDPIPLSIFHQLNNTQKISPLMAIFEPGLTIRREHYEGVGGFDSNISRWEGMDITKRLHLMYGLFCKYYVYGVSVFVSDRRISQIYSQGLNILDYETQFFR